MTRQTANRFILSNLEKVVEENPNLRFTQILQILGINELKHGDTPDSDPLCYIQDNFNEESTVTLKKIEKKVKANQ